MQLSLQTFTSLVQNMAAAVQAACEATITSGQSGVPSFEEVARAAKSNREAEAAAKKALR